MNTIKNIIVGSDGMGIYGIFTITNILKIAYPDYEIEWTNQKTPDLVIKSHFSGDERHPGYSCPYLTWSGESFPVPYSVDHLPLCQINTISETPGSSVINFHIPYAHNYLTEMNMYLNHLEAKAKGAEHCSIKWIEKDYLPSSRFLNTKERYTGLRPYFCVYIASNPINERDMMFNLLRSRTGHLKCHALGRCSNNLEQMKEDMNIYHHVNSYAHEKKYRKNIDILKHYRFSLVMENSNTPGYVTEKIINAFKAGTIPIYWGGQGYADTIFNPKAFIDISKFTTFEECADYIVALDANPDRIFEMQKEPIFLNNQIPDIFNGLNSKFLSNIGDYLKSHLNIRTKDLILPIDPDVDSKNMGLDMNWYSSSKLPGFSFMIRNSNQICIESLKKEIPSSVPYELIVIDEGSHQMDRHLNQFDRLINYPYRIAQVGLENYCTPMDSVHSMVYQTQFLMMKCQREWICHWDANFKITNEFGQWLKLFWEDHLLKQHYHNQTFDYIMIPIRDLNGTINYETYLFHTKTFPYFDIHLTGSQVKFLKLSKPPMIYLVPTEHTLLRSKSQEPWWMTKLKSNKSNLTNPYLELLTNIESKYQNFKLSNFKSSQVSTYLNSTDLNSTDGQQKYTYEGVLDTLLKNVYFINLSHRNDRLVSCLAELQKIGVNNPVRFDAISHECGAIGCTSSHIAVLDIAIDQKLDYICIVEDDVGFTDPMKTQDSLKKFIELNIEWDVLYMGGYKYEPYLKINEHLTQVFNCQASTMYIVKNHYFKRLRDHLNESRILLSQNNSNTFMYAMDMYWKRLQKIDKWYIIEPIQIIQKDTYSDVEKRYVNYDQVIISQKIIQ